jgi:hypothetical protein
LHCGLEGTGAVEESVKGEKGVEGEEGVEGAEDVEKVLGNVGERTIWHWSLGPEASGGECCCRGALEVDGTARRQQQKKRLSFSNTNTQGPSAQEREHGRGSR